MKQIFSDQNNAYISVMATSWKQFPHLLRIDVVYQIIKDHEERFAVCTSIVVRYSLVYPEFRRQLMTGGDCTLLAARPDYPAGKCALSTEVVEVL